MDSFNTAVNTASRMCKPIIGLALNLAILLLVVGLLFPEGVAGADGTKSGMVDIVGNVAGLVGQFVAGGLTGLIALLVFMAILDTRSTAG